LQDLPKFGINKADECCINIKLGKMSTRASIIQSACRFGLLAALLATSLSAKGTSIVFPKFSAPVLQEDRLVFTSPDGKRLLCASLDGNVVWERKFGLPIRLFTGPKSEALVQTGRVVSYVSAQSGEMRANFTVEDKNERVCFSSKWQGSDQTILWFVVPHFTSVKAFSGSWFRIQTCSRLLALLEVPRCRWIAVALMVSVVSLRSRAASAILAGSVARVAELANALDSGYY
jgi:hypothetical protein